MDMDFYPNQLGFYIDNNTTNISNNHMSNMGYNPSTGMSSGNSCGLIAMNKLARYHSAPTSVLEGLLLDDDDDDDGAHGELAMLGEDLLNIAENPDLSKLLNDGIGSFASLIDHRNPPNPPKMPPNNELIMDNINPNLALNPPLNHNLNPITHPQANYSDPTTNPNMVSNAMLATPPPNRSRRALNAQMNHFKLNQDRLNAQMNQKLNQDRLTAQIALFSTTPSSTSSSSSSSNNHSPTLSAISEQEPIINTNDDQYISLIPKNLAMDKGKQSTQYQNPNPSPNPIISPNLNPNPNPILSPSLNPNHNPNSNLSPTTNSAVDCLPSLYKSRPPHTPMIMMPTMNSVKPSGGLIRHSSSPAHFLSKVAREEMASGHAHWEHINDDGDHDFKGVSRGGAYNSLGQRKRGRGGLAHEASDKNHMQQQFGQQQIGMSPPSLMAEGLSPPNHTISCFDDVDGSVMDSVLCKARAKRGHATHPRSIAERVRRTKISDRIKKLQDLVPNLDKQANTADMLDEIVDYVKVLQQKIKDLSMDPPTCNCARRPVQSI